MVPNKVTGSSTTHCFWYANPVVRRGEKESRKPASLLWPHRHGWKDLAELLKSEVTSGWRCLWKEQLQPRVLFWSRRLFWELLLGLWIFHEVTG